MFNQNIQFMINFNELKVGDYVICSNDGDPRRGKVTNLNNDEKQVCIDNGSQEFWYELNQLSGISITDEELAGFKFHKETLNDGTIKYSKGAFRMLIAAPNNFNKMEIWYRDETRHIINPIQLHELQNHFFEMTKVHLDESDFD